MRKDLYKDLYDLEDKHWWHIAKRQMCELLIDKFIPKKRLSILDVGCGSGKNLEFFSKFGTVYGIDNSSKAIEFCKKRGLNNVRQANSSNTKLTSSKFDLVTLLDVLEHVNEESTFSEINRVLKNDGFLIISVPAYKFLWSKWDEILNHKRRYTRYSLKKILIANKFKIIKISYMFPYLVLPSLIIRPIKNLLYNDNYPSDFKLSNSFINKMMIVFSIVERKIMSILYIPFGTSIICICQKKS